MKLLPNFPLFSGQSPSAPPRTSSNSIPPQKPLPPRPAASPARQPSPTPQHHTPPQRLPGPQVGESPASNSSGWKVFSSVCVYPYHFVQILYGFGGLELLLLLARNWSIILQLYCFPIILL